MIARSSLLSSNLHVGDVLDVHKGSFGKKKVSPDGLLLQSSTVADAMSFQFSDGVTESVQRDDHAGSGSKVETTLSKRKRGKVDHDDDKKTGDERPSRF